MARASLTGRSKRVVKRAGEWRREGDSAGGPRFKLTASILAPLSRSVQAQSYSSGGALAIIGRLTVGVVCVDVPSAFQR